MGQYCRRWHSCGPELEMLANKLQASLTGTPEMTFTSVKRSGARTLKALKYVCINHGNKRVFQFEIIINVSVSCLFEYLWFYVINILIPTAPGPTL